VRVLVDREKTGIRIEGFDLVIMEAQTERVLAHESRRAIIEASCSLGGRMQLTTGSPGRKHHESVRANGPVRISSLGGFIRVGSAQYRDDLYVYSFNGDCMVVNHVDLEKYVAGLLNSEMSASWPLPTLMAQAVAARTYAIHQMAELSTTHFKGLRPPFDLESTVRDQVYEGAHKERYNAIRAVQETRGMILTYNGKPIKAFYHSTCGGHTEDPARVWGMRLPYLHPVRCEFCSRSPRFNWAYTAPTAELERKLKAEHMLQGSLLSMRVISRNRMNRAEKVEVRGTQGASIVAAIRVRDLLGTLNVRSTDFTVERNPQGGDFVFVGHGSGHGVGMCQWGAKVMGDRGRPYDEILHYYYPLANLTKLY
jgi:stage II sporulation protein D